MPPASDSTHLPSSSMRSDTPDIIPMQPDHFYGQATMPSPASEKGYLHPDDDPLASRGIPVFKPSMDEFRDFEGYMSRVECWGMKSGIVKIIPPKEWTSTLPSTIPQLANVKLRNPIEQEFDGSSGLYRQRNMERRKIMSVREWAELCGREEHRAPTIEEAQGGRRHAPLPPSTRHRSRQVRASGTQEPEQKLQPKQEDPVDTPLLPEHPFEEDGDAVMTDIPATDMIDPATSLPTPPPSTTVDSEQPGEGPSGKRSNADRIKAREAKEALDNEFLKSFAPHTAWLPRGMKSEDYTPEFCRLLEKIYWRRCGMGKPWYGADMKGSLFTDTTTSWNVASLPSELSRLLGNDSKISGVNTPYLYFGMWRATFAWHVEDMDLFSINYIHFGAPKYWYAIPQGKSQALENLMKDFFPGDVVNCPEFLRHKAYLVSPTKLTQASVRPNTLVQHPGEFVVTFPRGYHAGFNLGFNCAESVNFALKSWIELGKRAQYCTCVTDSVRIDVKGLLEEREMRARGEERPKGFTPSRKRKAEVLIERLRGTASPPSSSSFSLSKSKRPKIAPRTPDSIITYAIPSKSAIKSKVKPGETEPSPDFPCCLCVSFSSEGLLRVHDPPLASSGLQKPKDGVWYAHEGCARVIPETWVDDALRTDGVLEKVVWGVDGIVKDRWMLKCGACTKPVYRAHGAPIQCTKGKCSKSFHVSCAVSGSASDISYRYLDEVEKEVVLVDSEPAPAPPAQLDPAKPVQALPSTPPQVVKTIKKLIFELFCSQHNPARVEKKKADRHEKMRADLAAMNETSRIRIRTSSGVFEVSLVTVNNNKCTVEVLWDGGQKREFKWGSIVWGSDGQMAGSKPTADEIAKMPNPLPAITTNANPGMLPMLNPYIRPSHPAYQFATYQPVVIAPTPPAPTLAPTCAPTSVPAPLQPSSSTVMPYTGMSQFKVMPPSSFRTSSKGNGLPTSGTPSTTATFTPSWSGAYAYPAAIPSMGYLPYYSSNGYYNAYIPHRTPTIGGVTGNSVSAKVNNCNNAQVQGQPPKVSQPQPQGQRTPSAQPHPPQSPVSCAALQTAQTNHYLNRPFLPLAPQTVATMANAQTSPLLSTTSSTNTSC